MRSNSRPGRRRVLALATAWCWPALADEAPALSGTTLEGRSFDLATLRGKVVLVFLWRTDCAVCLSKLPELRLNAAGWHDRPFELVLVNADRQRIDVADYERTRALVHPGERRHPSLWRGEPGHNDTLPLGRLPLSLLLDMQGRTVARFEGRIPPEAWDRIADLLP